MNKMRLFNIDWNLMVPVFILIILGLTTLFSINISYFRSQFFFLILSFFVFLFFCQFNFRLVQDYTGIIYVISIVFLAFIFVIGIESRGAVRWIDIFGIRIQFSEILKPFLLLILASFLSRRNPSLKTLLSAVCLMIPIIGLIFLQPDLGNALIYLFTAFFGFLVFGFSFIWFALGLGIFAGLTPFIWKYLHEYQRQRILTFLYPTRDPLGKSYNAIQSIIAVGSGKFFGKGFQETTQSGLRFLPERHTDFIFATLSEGLGFVGAVVVLAAFGYLFYRIFLLYLQADDVFSKIFIACSFFLIATQFFVNIGMNIGIMPVVGITLPFVSYGGSSLLSNFILLGMLCSISSGAKKKRVLEIR